MTALQRLAEALEVDACRGRWVDSRRTAFVILEDQSHVSIDDGECWWRTFDAAELRRLAALALEVADELDAVQAAEVTHG